MSVRVRFAPSPTGYLHVGNIRAALINYLYAQQQGGVFLLRLDDTDAERSKQEYADAIFEDLRWLGLQWDGDAFRESERFDRYNAAKEQLVAAGRLYPCYETPEELDFQRKMQTGRGLPPIYNRASLKLSDEQKAEYEAQGRRPHWRFLLEAEDIVWNDLIRGEVKINGAHVSDPVLIREDGIPLYTFCSVVDDLDYDISHIVRGEDHVTNTATQIQIFETLIKANGKGRVPTFAHTALLKTKDGELSKRVGGSDIRGLRAEGMEPMAVNSLLARLGTSDPIEPFTELAQLVAQFDFGKFGRAPANYDKIELERLNEKVLLAKLPEIDIDYLSSLPSARITEKVIQHLSHSQVLCLLPNAFQKSMLTPQLWESMKTAIKEVDEIQIWITILSSEDNFRLITDNADRMPEFFSKAAELYPQNWNENSFSEWTNAVKEATGRKGKELFMPLRRALTGREDGPELKEVLKLLPREKAIARLKGEAA
jgi:glutamyl-tRNA synthetase